MKISIIIPVYNQANDIGLCIESIVEQRSHNFDLEIICIDDCSTDETFSQLHRLSSLHEHIRIFQTSNNGGPGAARNLGLQRMTGDWVIFLDSDDRLHQAALSTLENHLTRVSSDILNPKRLDFVAFNYRFDNESDNDCKGRNDLASLEKSHDNLIRDYLSLKMDGSVIFTCFNYVYLQENQLYFAKGFHEDVDFMFKAYFFAQRFQVLNRVLYIKSNRSGSIVNTLSKKHVDGFFRALAEIYSTLTNESSSDKFIESFTLGVIATVATRLRQICHLDKQEDLFEYLHEKLSVFSQKNRLNFSIADSGFQTQYVQAFKTFVYEFLPSQDKSKFKTKDKLLSIFSKTWSCYDLHNSIFIAPDQVRTCCKRFFVDGEMKGDVALLTGDEYNYSDFNLNNILNEKQKLYTEINKGESDKCTGCNFLEFKAWDNFKFEHLSFEYHSVCNMKCIYCSETYYGGFDSKYDVDKLLDELASNGKLTETRSIVWGGGEPTLGKNFDEMFTRLHIDFPDIQQRVITNATKLSPIVLQAISNNSANVVTSIDAGTKEKFFEVRKNKQFEKVFRNLTQYAKASPDNVTIKYIFMDENASLLEVNAFVNEVSKHGLQNCNFQISYDFKQESISDTHFALIHILYIKLSKLGAPLVFLDDLLVTRVKSSKINYSKVDEYFIENGFQELVSSNSPPREVVIWGAGMQTEALLSSQRFNEKYKVAYLVDNTPQKVGTKLKGYEILDPGVLRQDDKKVIISAVQNSRIIRQKYLMLGLSPQNLLSDMLL